MQIDKPQHLGFKLYQILGHVPSVGSLDLNSNPKRQSFIFSTTATDAIKFDGSFIFSSGLTFDPNNQFIVMRDCDFGNALQAKLTNIAGGVGNPSFAMDTSFSDSSDCSCECE